MLISSFNLIFFQCTWMPTCVSLISIFPFQITLNPLPKPYVCVQGQLEYIAIQSYDKTARHIAETKYRVSRELSSEHVLKVFKFCETESEVSQTSIPANTVSSICSLYSPTFIQNWIVMEYCAGGDLTTVVAQDHGASEELLCW